MWLQKAEEVIAIPKSCGWQNCVQLIYLFILVICAIKCPDKQNCRLEKGVSVNNC